jgi:hypothetical protein
MKKLLFFSLILLAAIGFSNTDKGTTPNGAVKSKQLFGKVKDQVTGETLAGVKIQVKGSDTYCYSDLDGNFNISVILAEKADLSIEVVGYNPVTLKSSEIGFNTDISLDPR